MDLASVLTLALLALFLAVQPWSVLAAILLVTSRGGVKTEGAYVSGWISALAVVAIVTVVAYPDVPRTPTSSSAKSAVELGAGLVLGGWLLWRWRHPRGPGTDQQPSWMRRLDTMSPWLALGLGAFLPTYVVVVAAVTEMLSSGLTEGWLLVAAVAWVLLASAGVASPLVVRLADREHAAETYLRWRTWIDAHSREVLFAAGGLAAIVLVIKGVVGLADGP